MRVLTVSFSRLSVCPYTIFVIFLYKDVHKQGFVSLIVQGVLKNIKNGAVFTKTNEQSVNQYEHGV